MSSIVRLYLFSKKENNKKLIKLNSYMKSNLINLAKKRRELIEMENIPHLRLIKNEDSGDKQ